MLTVGVSGRRSKCSNKKCTRGISAGERIVINQVGRYKKKYCRTCGYIELKKERNRLFALETSIYGHGGA
jgi:predicted nucleic-acid-binding Zn-ribbon protein